MKRLTLTPLNRILAADAQLASWNARREREAALLAVVRRVLPRPVAERVFVASGEGDTLELATPTGAVASVVRQKGPDILARLAAEGWKFSGIRLRVQPRQSTQDLPKPLPRQWDSTSRRPIAALCSQLPPGPLKAALGRFLKSR
jgi:hypothetical protein